MPVWAQQQVQGTGTAGSPAGNVLSIQGVASGTAVPISGVITANLGTLNGLFLDATFTGRMPAGASPANGESNTATSLSRIGNYNFIFNGSTWDRWTGAVTGTVTANAGTGTFAISAASLPLPALAATSTKQSDGTQKTQLVDGSNNVIGATANALDVNVKSGVVVAQGSTTSGQAGPIVMGAVTTAAPTYTTANTNPLSLQTDGSLRTAVTNTVTVGSHAVTNAGTFAVQATVSPTTASGDAVSACNILATASTNSISCKGSAGNVFGYELFNTTTTVYYLRLYNLATAPTCSSATGFVRSIPIPPAAAAGGVGGVVKAVGTFGVQFGTGIGYCITGGSSSTDNTNAAAGVFGELDIK